VTDKMSEKAAPTRRVGHGGHFRVIDLFKGSDLRFHIGALESDEGAFVAHLVAVVRSAEDCQNFASLLVLEALRLNLVTAHQQFCHKQSFR